MFITPPEKNARFDRSSAKFYMIMPEFENKIYPTEDVDVHVH